MLVNISKEQFYICQTIKYKYFIVFLKIDLMKIIIKMLKNIEKKNIYDIII